MPEGMATQKEVAAFLGMSVRYVQEIPCVGNNALTFYRIGRSVRYKWKDVEAWIEAHKAKVSMVAFQRQNEGRQVQDAHTK